MGKRIRHRNVKGRRRQTHAEKCMCLLQQPIVSENHAKNCPLYRQRGSGISVLYGPRANPRTTWRLDNDHMNIHGEEP